MFDVTEQQYFEYMRLHDETGFRGVAGDLPVEVKLTGGSGFDHSGKIDFVDNRLDAGTGTLRGHAVLENDNGLLVTGMFGRMRLAADTHANGILIPEKAINSDQATKLDTSGNLRLIFCSRASLSAIDGGEHDEASRVLECG